MGAAFSQGQPPKSAIPLELNLAIRGRVAGYDNHHPKGDHRHFKGHEEKYNYKDSETLIHDFLNDVKQVLSERSSNEG